MKIEFDTKEVTGEEVVIILKALANRFGFRLLLGDYTYKYIVAEHDSEDRFTENIIFTSDDVEHEIKR
jgi:hypothetical protein